MHANRICTIAICVFRHANKILVSDGVDALTQRANCRPLGGAVEFGERSTAAVVREIREELGAEIRDVRLLGVLENLFELEGQPGHEIVFVYDARFVDETLYERDAIPFHETDCASANARWFDLTQADADGAHLASEGCASCCRSRLNPRAGDPAVRRPAR